MVLQSLYLMETINKFLKEKITYGVAVKTVIGVCACVIIFHILIIIKVIPYSIVRWGRLTTDAEMYKFESVSLAINSLILLLVSMKWWFIKYFLPAKFVNVLLRWLFYLLIWNTIANIFSETLFEAVFFTILTWLIAVLIYRLQID